MKKASREFQVFAKPAGPTCNLQCRYCYYLKKRDLFSTVGPLRMSDVLLEEYIVQHIEASPGPVINFSWHGGEPTILGLDYFRKIISLQRTHQPPGQTIRNGIQTNGTLLDEDWCRFFLEEGFSVGISLDGPQELHNTCRMDKKERSTHKEAMRGYNLLRRYGIPCDILCVVHAGNVRYPLEVYRFFKEIGARAIGYLPLVERDPSKHTLSNWTVPADAFGDFLCAIFDEWLRYDVGQVFVQIFEETARTALGQEHGLCIFRETCGDIPVIEHNGDFFSCDHFVDHEHRLGNILETSLAELIESRPQRAFGLHKADSLPLYCRECDVLAMCNGGCPKDRFVTAPDGEKGLNYLCPGYKKFFTHSRGFVKELSALWQLQGRGVDIIPLSNQ